MDKGELHKMIDKKEKKILKKHKKHHTAKHMKQMKKRHEKGNVVFEKSFESHEKSW